MVRIRDVEAAEKAVDAAMAELWAYTHDPEQWSAHERIDEQDMRVLHLHKTHFERVEALQNRVAAAQNTLRATQQAFAGGDPNAAR